MATVLLISVGRPFRSALTTALAAEGHFIRYWEYGPGASFVSGDAPTLIVFDMRSADVDAHRFLRRLRSAYPQAMILALACGGSEAHVVFALGSGADQYVCKPIGTGELLARSRALLRRARVRSSTCA